MSLNKTVIITGASSGIGLGLVKAFLDHGYNVVGNARSQSGLDDAAGQLGHPASFIGVAGDVADPATSATLITQAIKAFGAVDGLVNNAGFFLPKPFVEYSPQDLDALLDTNLKGLVYASQAAAAHMIGRQQGFIINISAAVALQPNIQVPAALPVLIKGGVNQMTRALALELSPTTSRSTPSPPASSTRRCMIRRTASSSTTWPLPVGWAPSRKLPRPCCTWRARILPPARYCQWMAG